MPVSLPEGHRFHAEVSSYRAGKPWASASHSHAFFELLYIIEGQTTVDICGNVIVGEPGDLLIYYPHEEHTETRRPGVFSIVCLRFAPGVIDLPGDIPGRRETGGVVRLPWPERFQNLFERMVQEREMDDQWHDTMSGVYLVEFSVLLRRALSKIARDTESHASERSMHLENALELMHASLDTNLSLTELAERAHMSESHFSHTFKDATGLSPKKYQIRTKMLKAQELLRHSGASVKEVAASLGYDDPHYFSRLYKKTMGVSPSEAREQ